MRFLCGSDLSLPLLKIEGDKRKKGIVDSRVEKFKGRQEAEGSHVVCSHDFQLSEELAFDSCEAS